MPSEDTSIGDILVVDDNAANLTAIEAALDDLSGRVVRAQSGNDALRMLLERDFALILLDVKMPSMDGYETARLIRARRRSSYTPIVFMTAYGHDDADVLAAYELGAVDFLFKPIRPEVLRAKAAVFVELRQRTLEVERQAAQIREHERREHERSLQAEREHWEAESLRRQMEHLARADAYKDRFLAVLSHELRNPLSSIVAGLEVLRERLVNEAPVDATMRRTRDIVERQAKHLTRLVDDLLDITRISSGKVQLRKQDVLLAELVDQAVDTTQPMVKERSQELVVQLPNEPIVVFGDSIRLVQVIGNLLHNASRYTQQNGRIVLGCSRYKDEIEIRVSDNGRGIGKEFLPHVFEAFSQEAAHTGAGLGVGLSVVRQLVSLHDGTVAVHSEGTGKGCEFTVRLPLAAATEAQAKHLESSPPDRAKRMATRPLSIVLIDDSEDVREMMAELLRGWGHRVQVAPDGESGSELALRCRPDIAFIDIGLPKMDGYGVAEALRSHRELKTRLIAMTGSGQESDRRRAFDAGFDAHLVKPASIEALHAVLSFEERDARSTPNTSNTN
jgi:signal transduction histidine kinase